MERGWGLPNGDRAWHFFVGPRALCGARKHDGTRLYTVRPDLRLCFTCEQLERKQARTR